MNLVTVNLDSLRLGHPLPFALRNKEGTLLAHKGFVVSSRDYLNAVLGNGSTFFMDVNESDGAHRAYVGKLYNLIDDDKPLGTIAGAQIVPSDLDVNRGDGDDTPDWFDMQLMANALLRETNPVQFLQKLDRVTARLVRYTSRNPDGTLFALIHLAATEVRMYSATHAMLVSVMCALAAREVLGWSDDAIATLGCAALTMNIGMTELQDRLAQQAEAVSDAQRRQIESHADRSADILINLGVSDTSWLQAVREHHTPISGALAGRSEGNSLARVIQRADMFAARLSPRASRVPVPPAAAMQACYFDEERKIDEAGAALIKAVGIYSPGSYVKLVTHEVGVVVRRGGNTTTPRVAVLINKNGMPIGDLILRDTAVRDYRIVASVAHRDVKVKVTLDRLLALTSGTASDRRW